MIERNDNLFFTKQSDSVALTNSMHHFQILSKVEKKDYTVYTLLKTHYTVSKVDFFRFYRPKVVSCLTCRTIPYVPALIILFLCLHTHVDKPF